MKDEILLNTINLIKKAGQAILLYYNKKLEITSKGNNSPVTGADIASNKIICEELKKFEYGILSEEETDNGERLKKDRAWIIDPLDGTKDFIEKTGEFTIMIGLVEKLKNCDFYKPILGVVYKPIEDIVYYAQKGEGAYKTESGKAKRLKVSERKSPEELKMITSRFHLSPDIKKIANDLGIRYSVPCGSAGLKLGYIAEQKADLNINTSDKTYEWDICAADIILNEAGGKLTDMKGKEFIYNKDNPRNEHGYVASNGIIHKKIIERIKQGI